MTVIRHILKWGTGEWRTVLMVCGHKGRIRKADLKRAQLYIGRLVRCADCGEDTGRIALRAVRRR